MQKKTAKERQIQGKNRQQGRKRTGGGRRDRK